MNVCAPSEAVKGCPYMDFLSLNMWSFDILTLTNTVLSIVAFFFKSVQK